MLRLRGRLDVALVHDGRWQLHRAGLHLGVHAREEDLLALEVRLLQVGVARHRRTLHDLLDLLLLRARARRLLHTGARGVNYQGQAGPGELEQGLTLRVCMVSCRLVVR